MTTTTTAPAASAVDVARAALAAKHEEIGDVDRRLGELRASRQAAAIEGADTSGLRAQIRELEDERDDLQAQLSHAEGRVADAESAAADAALHARLADYYEEVALELDHAAKLRRAREAVRELEASWPFSQAHCAARDQRMMELRSVQGVEFEQRHLDHRSTAEDCDAEAERFRQLAASEREASR